MHLRLILTALLLKGVSAAKILALMVVPSHSHHIWNSKYLEVLISRGHEVTYFSVDQYTNPPKNVTQILVEGAYDVYDNIDFTEVSSVGIYRNTLLLYQWMEAESAIVMRSQGFKRLKELVRREKFDLVVHDFTGCWFLLGAVDLLGRPPVIAMTAFSVPSPALTVLGNPLAFSSNPYFLSQYTNNMNLLQRADNYFLHLWALAVHWFFMRKQDNHARSSFDPNIRPLEQILDDINIILVNANPAIDFPFPQVPGLISVGGLHIQKPKPLPQDLKTFLDESKDGVIYFSLGSNIQSSTLPRERTDILLEAFRRISPVRVLWKWESEELPKKPPNVRIGKWFPQNDVLAHPNVRLFFTHSGLLSTQEALYHGKPIVGMPFLLDQHVNVDKCVARGLGEKLFWGSLTVEKVVATLGKVLSDPKYAEYAKNASAIFRDGIEGPMDRAVYWTEYAIRHNGARHLRHSSRDLWWYQNSMLDVLALTACAVSLAVICARRLMGADGASRRKPERKKKE